MSPMIDDELKRDDLIIIVEGKQDVHSGPNDVKSIIKTSSFDRTSQPSAEVQHPKSILKTSSKLSKSFDQPNPKQPILKRHSFDICFPSTSKTTHSILKHSSNDEDTEDDKPVMKPILKKNKSLEHFQESDQLINIKPILKKKDEPRCD